MKLIPFSRFPSGRRGPLLVLCLPVICSCLMGWIGSRPQPIANIPELPSLAFDQYLVDLREIAPTEEVMGHFGFRNTSPHTVTITKLEPSCGCLQPVLRKSVIEPGKSGHFALRIKTALQQPGPKEFTVKVHYTDSKPRIREVYLRATFPELQMYIRPMSLTFHQLGTSPVEQEFTITDLRANPADIIGATVSSEIAQLQVLEPTITSSGVKEQRVRVTVPGAVASGRQVATIKIFTSDEKFHELKVPIQVFGPKAEKRQAVATRMVGPQSIGPIRR